MQHQREAGRLFSFGVRSTGDFFAPPGYQSFRCLSLIDRMCQEQHSEKTRVETSAESKNSAPPGGADCKAATSDAQVRPCITRCSSVLRTRVRNSR